MRFPNLLTPVDWPEAIRKGEVWAAGLNAVALGALFMTRSWWWGAGGAARADDGCDETRAAKPVLRTGWRHRDLSFVAGLAVVVILAGALRWKFAHSSLWWDEVWQARHASVGEWRVDRRHPGELRFVPTTWAQALWNYRKPTNHPPMAVASKACHEVWRHATGAAPGQFNEFVLRLPGFIASLAGIAMIALLLRAWGLPGAGLAAGCFLAVHPWHIRYGIDGRGYTFLVPLTILGIWAVWRACGPRGVGAAAQAVGVGRDHGLEMGAARPWWWTFGVVQALILWCHPLSLWVCAGLAGAGLWWIWRGHSGRMRRRLLARFAAAQMVGAMVLLQLFMPNLLQATTWGAKNQDGMVLDLPHLLGTLTQIACGTDIAGPPPTPASTGEAEPDESPVQPAWEGGYRWARWTPAFVGLLACWGWLSVRRSRHGLAAASASLLASCGFFLAVVAVAGFYFYPRFVFSAIVPTALLVGTGVASAVAHGRKAFSHGSAPAKVCLTAGAALVLILSFHYSQTISPMVSLFRETPYTPLRETAAALRTASEQGARVFGYGFGAEALQYYLPELAFQRESPARPALEAAIEQAQAAGKPLLVAVGYEAMNRQKVPDGFALLDDPAVFAQDSVRIGLEPQFAYRILKSVPPGGPPPR